MLGTGGGELSSSEERGQAQTKAEQLQVTCVSAADPEQGSSSPGLPSPLFPTLTWAGSRCTMRP